jgi:outer membrane PBP1 activator LpoA protein
VLAALLLYGCGMAPPRPPAAESAAQEVARLIAAGDHRGAAQRLLAEAERAQPPQREELQLEATEILLRGQQYDAAETLLGRLPQAGSDSYATRLAIVQARLSLQRGQSQPALQRLAAVSDAVPPALQVDFHRTRAEAYAAAGNHLESARERVWLDGLLDAADRPANQQALWETLATLPDAVLAGMRTAPPPDVFSGWLELIETTRAQRDNPQQLEIALAIWQERYPRHPAAPDFIAGLRERLAEYGRAAQPGHIAVLLPLSGTLAEAGQAIRDGMLAAHFHAPARGATRLQFYDTEGGAIRDIYQRAVAAGAQQIIGPLTKESVAALAGSGELPVPVLALNNLGEDTPAPAQMYQFGLTPEDEAAQVAERAWQDGHRRALALIPEGAWGERILRAFAQHWQASGGTLLEVRHYGADQREYSDAVSELLNLDAGAARLQALTRQLGRKPEFEPRRRQDADFVLMVGQAQQVRLLRPLLRFHHASRLPVYATSQVYEGGGDPALDHDLDGLRFCDMPWILSSDHPGLALRAEIARLWPAQERRYGRLYAMGIDALQVAPYLRGLGDGTFARHPGVTGDLYLDRERRVHRDLQWAEFRNGVPAALPASLPPAAGTPDSDNDVTPQDFTDEYPAAEDSPATPGNAR